MRSDVGEINMKISEVTKTVELKTITIETLNPPNRDCKIKVSFLKDIREEKYSLFVTESDNFELNRNNSVEDTELFIGSQSLLWETIKGKSEEEIYRKLAQDVELMFPVEEGEEMRKFEVVKILEVDTSQDEKNECFSIRIEILKEFNSNENYSTNIYRLINFDLKPTFPLSDNYETASVSVFVKDESSELSRIKGRSIEEIMEKLFLLELKLDKG